MSEELKTAQEVVTAVDQMESMFAGLIRDVRSMMNDYSQHAMRRTSDMVLLTDDASDETVARANTHIRTWARFDEMATIDFDNHMSQLAQAMQGTKKLSKALAAIWNGQLSELNRAQADLASATARLKEHSINCPHVRTRVWSMTDGQCFHCEAHLTKPGAMEDGVCQPLHVDHLVPKSSGGPDHISNYVPACPSCNSSKGPTAYVEWVRQRRAKLTVIQGSAA